MPEFTQEDARHVLHYFGHPQGWKPGTFTERLIAAIAHSDSMNEARLGLSFPGLVQAMRVARYEPGGIDRLLEAAENSK